MNWDMDMKMEVQAGDGKLKIKFARPNEQKP